MKELDRYNKYFREIGLKCYSKGFSIVVQVGAVIYPGNEAQKEE